MKVTPTDDSWTVSIPTTLLAPEIGKPTVRPQDTSEASQNFRITGWEVRVPVTRIQYGDKFDVSKEFCEKGGKVEWWSGNIRLGRADTWNRVETSTPQRTDKNVKCEQAKEQQNDQQKAEWDKAQNQNQISLRITVPREALRYLPAQLELLRDGTVISTLRRVREAILPSKLKLQVISSTQFSLVGENAGVIDAVSVGQEKPLPAVAGSGFVLVTIPAKKKPQDNASDSTKQDAESSPESYAVLPLVSIEDGNYIPVEVIDQDGKPLIFTPPKSAEKAAQKPDETITITEKSEKTGSAQGGGATPPQGTTPNPAQTSKKQQQTPDKTITITRTTAKPTNGGTAAAPTANK
jgi:hypothetical protein